MPETTTITRRAGEHTLLATVSTEFTEMAQSILGIFEGQAADLRDGYILQFGWGPIFLEAEGDALRLTTPDYWGDAANDRTERRDPHDPARRRGGSRGAAARRRQRMALCEA